ncbi:DUF2892 domain-containing protein [Fictibacillus sp. WQ 8-8]|uniref:DUF2892 domain-containing protein n=1 Tax=Fictibacillus marinisediminis TaxID=2878389 RepID=A0A9X1X924_9BACL|nr:MULTISPECIES: DUF2892 domain-containing protein [Fictibacillus]SFE62010.1 Protein of unknown function [Bacillus sp. OV194]MCK6255375.1 DUF2892 domain-containing protein [Fictibacillus marinisediminis]MCQ6268564.1 DUF2892 domain-containing protein [Fictibacillus sp. WQ 8-8]MED2974679.1 DUF2892 domain-containing protein [Fictibacillus sp. B-59209]UZJ78688.1 DUF2892 domain-containing protein [Fictibacillus sp. KU28468]
MKQNIGILNSMIRIVCGLTMLAMLTAKYTRRPYRGSYVFMMILASMKVAEGILRYCPVTDMIKQGSELKDMDLDDISKEGSAINPS